MLEFPSIFGRPQIVQYMRHIVEEFMGLTIMIMFILLSCLLYGIVQYYTPQGLVEIENM